MGLRLRARFARAWSSAIMNKKIGYNITQRRQIPFPGWITCFDGKMGEGLALGVDDTTPELVLSRILFMASFIWRKQKSTKYIFSCSVQLSWSSYSSYPKTSTGRLPFKTCKRGTNTALVAFKDSQESEVWVPKRPNSAVKTTVKNYLKKSIMREWFYTVLYNN